MTNNYMNLIRQVFNYWAKNQLKMSGKIYLKWSLLFYIIYLYKFKKGLVRINIFLFYVNLSLKILTIKSPN